MLFEIWLRSKFKTEKAMVYHDEDRAIVSSKIRRSSSNWFGSFTVTEVSGMQCLESVVDANSVEERV